jgi:molybdenum cofactor cytidylyltransferase
MPAFDTGPSMPEVESENKSPTVFAVVLAAGGSNRFGRSKQLEGFEGRPLVRRAAELARSVCGDRNVLLVGHESAAVVAAAGDAPQYLVVNDRYEEGLGGSIALAAKTLSHVANAVLLLFTDQPLITARHLRALIDTWSGADSEIVATAFSGTLGPPVLFPRGAFAAEQSPSRTRRSTSTHPVTWRESPTSRGRALLDRSKADRREP